VIISSALCGCIKHSAEAVQLPCVTDHRDARTCDFAEAVVVCNTRRYLPYIGMVTIVMNDYPWVKYLLIGVLGLFVITGKD